MGYGLRFRNIDLHVHTPASDCFIEPDVTPQDIVNKALEVKLDAIAITDHNSADWIDCVKKAAQGTGLTVFPGVEITVQPGIHVIALFPTDRTSAHVIDLLAELGIGVDDRGNPQALTCYGIQEVINCIRRHDALPVLAHIDDVKGAWHELRGQTRVQLWQEASFAAVEIIGNSLPDKVGRSPYERQPAYYWASDNPHPDQPTKHSQRGIGARSSWFKLDDPITWEGLRQCFEDPRVRIHREPPELVHPMIERIQVFGGFLDQLDVTLNPNLNCIIGGRGTGKSALLEIVRHTFDISFQSEENERQAQSLLTYAFPSGARATVHLTVDGVRYRVERVSGRSPQIFRAGEDEPLSVPPAELLSLQVYGQKEIYQISLDPEFQLRLLDSYVAEALKSFKEEENSLLLDLRANADEILRREEFIYTSQEWLARLGAIREEIRRMEDADFVARVKSMEQHDHEKRLLEEAQTQVNELLYALRYFASQYSLNDAALDDAELVELPNREMLQAQRKILTTINQYLERQFANLYENIARKWAEGEAQRRAWQRAYTDQEKAYQQLLREFAQAGEIGPDRYMQLQQRKAELETRAREVEEYKARIVTLMERRKQVLLKLRQVRKQQYLVRRKKAKELTEALDDNVRITLWPEGYRQVYKDYLRELFRGLNVRDPKRSELAETKAAKPEREAEGLREIDGQKRYLVPEIPCYLDPIDLAEAIRVEQERADEAESVLEARFGVDSDAMRRNMAGLSRRQLFELELFAVPDLPVIELQVGSGLLGYRPLKHLSVGQRCTALLSIVLLESSAPLLIDQPEDDLDNQYIFDKIVATLRRRDESQSDDSQSSQPKRRQFLIATHNANIPVSGDADLILALEAGYQHGNIAPGGIGSIDNQTVKEFVARILEGGSVAFRIRKEKYGKMIEE